MILPSGASTFDYSITAAARGWNSGWPNCQAPSTVITVAKSGQKLITHPRIARLATLLFNAMESKGYMMHLGWNWGGECRAIAGTSRPSNHSWNLAFDINAPNNPYTTSGQHDIPDWVYAMFRRYGFGLGADYNGKKDWMHVEFMGTPGDADIMTTAAEREFAGGGGSTPTPPPVKDDSMSAADVEALKRYIDEKLSVTSLVNGSQMSVKDMVAYIDNNLHTYGRSIAPLALMRAADNQGAVYAYRPGVFFWVTNGTELLFLQTYGMASQHIYESNQASCDVVKRQMLSCLPAGAVLYNDDGGQYWSEGGESYGIPDPETRDGLLAVAAARGVRVLGWPGGDVDTPGAFGARGGNIPRKPPPPPPTTYVVVKGDTFNAIAAKLGKSVDALAAANPQVTNRSALDIGQVLNVP